MKISVKTYIKKDVYKKAIATSCLEGAYPHDMLSKVSG